MNNEEELKLYFIVYGNYIHEYTDVIEAYSEEEAVDEAYHRACDINDNTQGNHGFLSVEEILEDNPDMSEEEAYEEWHQYSEDHAEYYAELYDPEKHNDML